MAEETEFLKLEIGKKSDRVGHDHRIADVDWLNPRHIYKLRMFWDSNKFSEAF